MEPFDSPFYTFRMATALLLTFVKIMVAIIGISLLAATGLLRINRSGVLRWFRMLDLVSIIQHNHSRIALALAFLAILPAEIIRISQVGGQPNTFLWSDLHFLLLYWGIVAVSAVPIGVVLGIVDLTNNRK